jgi:hypothetical protein
MKIGRLQIICFENFWLGSELGKPVVGFWVKIRRRGLSIQFYKYCLKFHIKRKRINTGL